jgi:histidinol-phosphate aminotransferase
MQKTKNKTLGFKKHIKNFSVKGFEKAGKTIDEVKSQFPDLTFHKLSSNENCLGPSPKAVKAISNALSDLERYDFRTVDAFTQALSNDFTQQLLPENFIVGNGGLEILDLVTRAFVDPGDEVIISNPTFHIYELFAKVQGAIIRDVQLNSETLEIEVGDILDQVTDKTKLIYVTNPGNPTGVMFSAAAVKYLVDNVPDHVLIVHDEAYWQYVDSSNYSTALPFVQEGKNVLGLRSFSKGYGLPSMRIGFGYAPKSIISYIRKLTRPFLINKLSTVAAIAALNDHDHIEKT